MKRYIPDIILLVVVLSVLALWQHERENAAAARALAEQLQKEGKAKEATWRDSLRVARIAVDSSRQAVAGSIAAYSTQRIRIAPPIVRVDTISVAGKPDQIKTDTSYQVSPAFIAATDSLRTTCSALNVSCQRAQVASDSVVSALAQRLAADARLLSAQKRRGFLNRLGDWGTAGGIVAAACLVSRR